MVKIFKKPEVKCFFNIFIRLVLRKPCSQINSDLFIPESCFQNGLFSRCHPVYRSLLSVFNSPDFSNCFTDIRIRTKSCKCVFKIPRFNFNSVHQNLAGSGVAVNLMFVERPFYNFVPASNLFIKRYTFFFQRIKCHFLFPFCFLMIIFTFLMHTQKFRQPFCCIQSRLHG